MNIGFLGLGIMGQRMAKHLLQAGHKVTAYNRTPSKAQTLLEDGAMVADSPSAAVADAEMVITMLAHPQAVEETALGSQGFLQAMLPEQLWIDCSTVHPEFSKQMAAEAQKQKIHFLDAPVAGSKPQAEAGQLVFFVGGERTAYEKANPLFEIMGTRALHVGSFGQGSALKMVVNHLLGTSMAAFAEGLILGEALGLSQETMLQVLLGGPVTPPYLSAKKDKLVQNDYSVEFPLEWMHKDLKLVATAAKSVGLELAVSEASLLSYQHGVEKQLGRKDFTALYQALKEKQTGFNR